MSGEPSPDALDARPAAPRPMRRAKREVTDSDELRAIIEGCRTVRLGFQDAEGVFIVPMNFGYDWTTNPDGTPRLTLWLHSAREGRKAEAVARGGAAGATVAFEMDIEDGVTIGDYSCAYSFAYRSIMGTGRAASVEDPNDKLHGLERLMEHLSPNAPVNFSPEAIERVVVWRIDVEQFRGKRRV